jgi:hypothetical protein
MDERDVSQRRPISGENHEGGLQTLGKWACDHRSLFANSERMVGDSYKGVSVLAG